MAGLGSHVQIPLLQDLRFVSKTAFSRDLQVSDRASYPITQQVVEKLSGERLHEGGLALVLYQRAVTTLPRHHRVRMLKIESISQMGCAHLLTYDFQSLTDT